MTFTNGNFDTFAAALREIVDLNTLGNELPSSETAADNAALLKVIEDSIKEDLPVCFSRDNGNGTFHVFTAVGVDGPEVRAYEPFTGTFIKQPLEAFQPNRNYLRLAKFTPPSPPAAATP